MNVKQQSIDITTGTSKNEQNIVIKNVLNLGEYNLLQPDLKKWLTTLRIQRQTTHLTAEQILDYISRIPEIKIINNLVFPNWIINTWKDIDHGLIILLRNPKFWVCCNPKYNWIDARGISIFQPKFLFVLELILVELLKMCNYVIINVPEFMLITEFWEWLITCKEITNSQREQIIFFTQKQAKYYKTTASGIIPLTIGKLQSDFYNTYRLTINKIRYNTNIRTGSQENKGEIPIVIQELNKLTIELQAYQLASPDVLEIETGFILEKINNIREQLNIR